MKGLTTRFNLLLFVAITFVSLAAWTAEKVSYRFGAVPQFEQRKLFRIWRPILDDLERRTGLTFKLEGSAKIPEFELKYLEGVYDFAYMNPYHILLAHDSQGYLPLVRDGGRVLKGILVVAKDSPVQQVQDLDGKSIAFPSPNALGASLLMRADLANLHQIEILPHYVKTHSSVYLHVALGMNAAGGGVASTLNSQKPELREKLRILYETRSMTPHPVSAHPRVPEEHRIKVQQALLEMANTQTGKALLAEIPMYKAVAASLDDYSPMRAWGLEEFLVTNNQPGQPVSHEHEQ